MKTFKQIQNFRDVEAALSEVREVVERQELSRIYGEVTPRPILLTPYRAGAARASEDGFVLFENGTGNLAVSYGGSWRYVPLSSGPASTYPALLWGGNWAAATTYVAGTLVKDGSTLAVANTSTSTQPSVDPTDWTVL